MRYVRSRWVVPAVCGLCLLTIALVPVSVPVEDDTDTARPVSTPGTNVVDARPVGAIVAGKPATQQFPAAGTHIRSIALMLATYQRTNHGPAEAIIQASDASGQWQDLATRTIEKETLSDNAYYTLTFSPQLAVVKGQPIRITLRSDGGQNDAISWWTNANLQPDDYVLTYGGRPQKGTATFRVGYAAASGPLIATLGPLWHRVTIFLSPLWQGALIASLSLCVAGIVALCYFRLR